jgi:alpha-galactosidase
VCILQQVKVTPAAGTLLRTECCALTTSAAAAAGDKTCSGRPGSCRHEASDAEQFVRWGISHVKDDACSFCRDPLKKGGAADYAAMASGLRLAAERQSAPKPILMVEGQPPLPDAANGSYGDVRRVGHDINPSWVSMVSLIDIGSGLWRFARPGFFNDLGEKFTHGFVNTGSGQVKRTRENSAKKPRLRAEMMELGNGEFIAEQGPEALARARAHMSMWAVMKSPLVLSTNLSALGPETLQVRRQETPSLCFSIY